MKKKRNLTELTTINRIYDLRIYDLQLFHHRINHLTDIVPLHDFKRSELDFECLLDSNNQLNMAQRVPLLNVIGTCLVGQVTLVQIKHIGKDLVK